MAIKAVLIEKDFKAVDFMRRQRDKISKDIAKMDFEEIREYFSKRRIAKRVTRKKKLV